MKFSHLADLHIGGWRSPRLRPLAILSLKKIINESIKENVDFVLISGDLFNTSLPSIDEFKTVMIQFKRLKEKEIPIYLIPGSHDFSPTGKTMIDILETANLCINVFKGKIENGILNLEFTTDKKTGAKITGILGKKGTLEKKFYNSLNKSKLEAEDGFKIFMFHTALDGLKPKGLENMESMSESLLPNGFNYYAGGHVHSIIEKDNPKIVFPGPGFPNNFKELEELEHGGFYIYDNGKTRYMPIHTYNLIKLKLNCTDKTPEQIKTELELTIKDKKFTNNIVTLRLYGKIESGKIIDINLNDIIREIYLKGAYIVLKNTTGLLTKEYDQLDMSITSEDTKDIENVIIKKNLESSKLNKELTDNRQNIKDDLTENELTSRLIRILSKKKEEGTTKIKFEEDLKKDIFELIDI